MRRCISVLAVLFLASVNARGAMGQTAQGFNPEVTKDAFTGETTTDLTIEHLDHDSHIACSHLSPKNDAQIYVDLINIRSAKSGNHTYVRVEYAAPKWIFLDDEQAIYLLINGSPQALHSGAQGGRDVLSGSLVDERQNALISAEQVNAIGRADSVMMRISGDKGQCDFPLNADAIALARLFGERVLTADSTAARSQ